MEIDTGEYQGIMHMVADKLIEAFEGSDAANYIEQTFEDKENPERCFVLTMQMKEGLTPCQKLSTAEDRIKKLEDELSSMTHAAKELHAAISEYSLMPCKSLKTRMMSTANRYASRIFGVTNEPK